MYYVLLVNVNIYANVTQDHTTNINKSVFLNLDFHVGCHYLWSFSPTTQNGNVFRKQDSKKQINSFKSIEISELRNKIKKSLNIPQE
jgi:hypothetical protein